MTWDTDELIQHYHDMVLIRAFEQAVDELFSKGVISGTAHLSIGQEASAVGAVAALRPDDLLTSNHRGHGHFIAKGADPKRVMAELFGKATGYSKGRGGSQHMADPSIGFIGSNGITGGMIPIATGAALTQDILQTGRIVLCFLGDGASGQGAFYEALNMAANWHLPIIYLCENNLYAMSTPVSDAFKQPDVAKRVAGFGLPTHQVDGNDYFAVRRAVSDARTTISTDSGPVLIEALTYRMCGHSKSDDCAYRTEQEEQAWADRDPIRAMRRRLIDDDIATTDQIAETTRRVDEQIQAAIQFAQNSPEPEPETVADDVFVGF